MVQSVIFNLSPSQVKILRDIVAVSVLLISAGRKLSWIRDLVVQINDKYYSNKGPGSSGVQPRKSEGLGREGGRPGQPDRVGLIPESSPDGV